MNDVDCGYYVLRYMRSLILSELPHPVDKVCNFSPNVIVIIKSIG